MFKSKITNVKERAKPQYTASILYDYKPQYTTWKYM